MGVNKRVSDEDLAGALDGTESFRLVQAGADKRTLFSTLKAWIFSVITTKGDLLVGTGAGAMAREAVGADTYVLTADSAQTNGIKWAAPTVISAPPVTAVGGTTHTLALTEAPASSGYAGIIDSTGSSACTITVDTFANVAFAHGVTIQVNQIGTGQVSVVGASGVTVRNASSNTTRAQYSQLLLTHLDDNLWLLSGDMT
jgi:hypothetical protein